MHSPGEKEEEEEEEYQGSCDMGPIWTSQRSCPKPEHS